MHEQRDHRVGPGGEMRRAGPQVRRQVFARLGRHLGKQPVVLQQMRQRERADPECGLREIVAPRQGPGNGGWIGAVH